MITKVYFPRLILPLAAIFSKLLDFAISFVVLLVLLIYYQVLPGWQVIFFPILLVQLLACSLGIGMILSAMAVQYRDVKYALGFIVQILLYGAPVVYSTTAVPEQYQFFYSLNPMVGVIEGIRAMFLDRPMPWEWIWPGAIVAVMFFVFGLFYFRRMEKVFADVA
jgi:lipopolysaccharide transport system permease protein